MVFSSAFMLLLVLSPLMCAGGEIEMKGMTFTADRYCKEVSLDSDGAMASLEHLASTGANWVAIVVTWYQVGPNSEDIFPLNKPFATYHKSAFKVGFWNYTYVSETPNAVKRAILKAKQLGLKVMLKPHIDLIEDQAVWRGVIAPRGRWWQSYEKMLLMWARLAQKLDVEMLSVATELVAVSMNEPAWRKLVAKVRKVYSGKLTCAANWAMLPRGGELTDKRWWDVMDYIGVDEYMPLPHAKTVDEIVKAWKPLVEQFKGVSEHFNNTPVLLTEVGYCSGKACLPDRHDTPAGEEDQARHYEALLKVIEANSEWLKGVFWWNWVSDPAFGEARGGNTCMDPKWKKAETVLRQYYGATKPQPPKDTSRTPSCLCTL